MLTVRTKIFQMIGLLGSRGLRQSVRRLMVALVSALLLCQVALPVQAQDPEPGGGAAAGLAKCLCTFRIPASIATIHTNNIYGSIIEVSDSINSVSVVLVKYL